MQHNVIKTWDECEVNHRHSGNQVCLRQKIILLSILLYIFITDL